VSDEILFIDIFLGGHLGTKEVMGITK
jgi:hypothetical protein